MDFRIVEVDPQFAFALEDRFFRRQYERHKAMSDAGTALREARKRLGVSQEELARRAGTTQSAVSRFETAYRGATVDLAVRFARALGVTLPIG